MIDLSAALKVTEKEVFDKQIKIESLEAEILVLRQDVKQAESMSSELESTNQLLKVMEDVFLKRCFLNNLVNSQIRADENQRK